MKRKEFIKAGGLACIAGIMLPAFLQGCSSAAHVAQAKQEGDQLILKKSEFIKIEKGRTTEMDYVLVRTEQFEFPICVYKLEDGNYSALLLKCTHSGCELEPNKHYLACPCHGSEFSKTGEVQNPPAEQNLKTFKIKTDLENIYLYL